LQPQPIGLAAESTREVALGMSMGEVDGEDVEALQAEAYQRGAEDLARQLAARIASTRAPGYVC
jgi:hypothetical protein